MPAGAARVTGRPRRVSSRTLREFVCTTAGEFVKLARLVTRPTTTRIGQFLAENAISQTWLAKKLDVTRIAVSQWVHRKEKVPRRRQAQIGYVLGVDVSTWFDEDGLATLLPGKDSP